MNKKLDAIVRLCMSKRTMRTILKRAKVLDNFHNTMRDVPLAHDNLKKTGHYSYGLGSWTAAEMMKATAFDEFPGRLKAVRDTFNA